MAKNSMTDAQKRAAAKPKRGIKPGDKVVNRQKKSNKNVVRPENTYFGGRQADIQAKREARVERNAQAEVRRMEFAATQYMQAIQAPHVTKDRANGGVEGYARELAIDLIDLWALTTKEAAEAAGAKTRLDLAMRKLNARLRTQYTDELQAKNPQMSTQDIKAKVNERVQREYGLRGVAKRAARDAIDYGFAKAGGKAHQGA